MRRAWVGEEMIYAITVIVVLAVVSVRLYLIAGEYHQEALHWQKKYFDLTGGEITLEDLGGHDD